MHAQVVNFLNREDVQAALGVNKKWVPCAQDVYSLVRMHESGIVCLETRSVYIQG